MSIIQFPTGLTAAKQSWSQQRQDVEFRSMFGAQALEGSGPLWATEITAPPSAQSAGGGAWQAVMLQLRGRVNQLALWNLGRPRPIGTMRGAMTMAAAAQGATILTITASGQAGTTLLAGDYLGVGSGLTQQVVMVLADAAVNGSGSINVTTEPPLRNAFGAGAAVVWDRPCALFRRKSSQSKFDYEPGQVSGMMLDLLEDPRP
jgi:hypothetical protein